MVRPRPRARAPAPGPLRLRGAMEPRAGLEAGRRPLRGSAGPLTRRFSWLPAGERATPRPGSGLPGAAPPPRQLPRCRRHLVTRLSPPFSSSQPGHGLPSQGLRRPAVASAPQPGRRQRAGRGCGGARPNPRASRAPSRAVLSLSNRAFTSL